MLEVRGIHKNFPGVRALSDVSITLHAGTVHALMGENGAGKSTLGKIIAGLYQPDQGEVLLNGQPVTFRGPADAKQHGIGIVHQELLFCENLTVAENLSLAVLPKRFGFLDRKAMDEHALKCLQRINSEISPGQLVKELTVAQQQLVQIAATLAQGAKIIIFDEPTSSLTSTDVTALLEQIQQLKEEGILCIYVSHRLDEIFRVCDTVSVLRDGVHVGTRQISDIQQKDLVEMMVGRNVELGDPIETSDVQTVAKVENLNVLGKVANANFEIRKGEILGFAGLIGSGRTETLEALFGLQPGSTGLLNGENIPSRATEAVKKGLALVPEDRKRHGLVLGMSVRENMTFPILSRFSKAGMLRSKKELSTAESWIRELDIRPKLTEVPVGGLSGGNQQKVVIARWLAAETEIVLVDEPTRGVDIGAKAEIHNQLRELARKGKAVVVVSSELPELRALANRILVFRNGRIVKELAGGSSESEIVSAMVS